MRTLSFLIGLVLFVSLMGLPEAKLEPGECEVCIKVMDAVIKEVRAAKLKDLEKIERKIEQVCRKQIKDEKEQRLCWFIGAMETSATFLLRTISVPLRNQLPADRICERLKDVDSQICSLSYSSFSEDRKAQPKKGPVQQSEGAKEQMAKERAERAARPKRPSPNAGGAKKKAKIPSAAELGKMRVRELKAILAGWGERCDGCVEKESIINKINQVRGKYEKADL